MTVLADLRRLNQARTQGEWSVGQVGEGSDAVTLWLNEDGFLYEADREVIAAAANHLGDLLAVAEAAQNAIQILEDSAPEWFDELDYPQFDVLRAALAPLLVPQEAGS